MPTPPRNVRLVSATESDDPLVDAAVAAVRRRDRRRPRVAIILGSGLGELADEIESATRIAYSDLPGLARSTAAGHRGELILGKLDGVSIVALSGRVHRYEGHLDDRLGFPVAMVAALGAERLIVSNAAGGLHPGLRVGDIVIIGDHIDLARRSGRSRRGLVPTGLATPSEVVPGPLTPGRMRSDHGEIYDAESIAVALAAARAGDFRASVGTYIATLGPTYETRAEYRMMRRFGGDVVGMSTAPEATAAARLGMRVLGLSMVSNVACPDRATATDHDDVLAVGLEAVAKVRRIVAAVLRLASDAT